MLEHQEVQAALSARVDGEPTGYPDDVIDAHLASCEQCQAFYREIIALSQTLQPATRDLAEEPAPDLSDVILAGVEPEWRRRAASRALGLAVTRLLLVLLGLIFVGWSVSMLATTPAQLIDDGYSALLVESAAFRLALGFGLFFAAWQPRLVVGMVPILGALFTFSAGFAARDVVLGMSNAGQLGHLFLLFVTLGVLVWSWLNNYGADAFRHTWEALSAKPQ
ncbi:zf-HC2 domain-containing protein [Corynebacterium halotolerans]|uniref:zf-HC2 domain-containing protein n=1 Tax=Corynebacterium halotolerans TaxID=225326 RepID=UPI003CED94F7